MTIAGAKATRAEAKRLFFMMSAPYLQPMVLPMYPPAPIPTAVAAVRPRPRPTVLPSNPPTTAPPMVPAMQLNSAFCERCCVPEGAWHATSVPRHTRTAVRPALFSTGLSIFFSFCSGGTAVVSPCTRTAHHEGYVYQGVATFAIKMLLPESLRGKLEVAGRLSGDL